VFARASPSRSSGSRRAPTNLRASGTSSLELRSSSETLPDAPATISRHRSDDQWVTGSSLEVPCPFSVYHPVSRHIDPVPTESPSLRDLSQVLEGLILTELRGLVSCHIRSWGFRSPRLSPANGLPRARHSRIPSRRFPQPVSRPHRSTYEVRLAPRPQGFSSRGSPSSSGRVFHLPKARCLLELSCRPCGSTRRVGDIRSLRPRAVTRSSLPDFVWPIRP
jgi:hypothetical protein